VPVGAQATFPGPVPRDAIDFFESKARKPGFDFRDVWRAEHATAFTVAKAMQLDVLRDIQDEVGRAIAEGRTFREFQRELTPRLQKLGWWGRQERADPLTGEVREVQLGSPRRLKTLYTATLRPARAAGQWERIQRTKEALPFLLYQLGPSERHRPQHVQWHGVLLSPDDAWWQSHMPPNGWGCKCWVRQVGAPEAERLGREGTPAADTPQEINPDTGLPTGRLLAPKPVPVQTRPPAVQTRRWLNQRTGQEELVPVGIDPGWDTNPGAVAREAHGADVLADKLASAPVTVGAAAWKTIAPLVLPRARERVSSFVDELAKAGAALQTRGESWVVGALTPKLLQAVNARLRASSSAELTTAAIIARDDRLKRMRRATKAQRAAALSIEDLRRLPDILNEPRAVLWDKQDPALVYVFEPLDPAEQRLGKIIVRVGFTQRVRTRGVRQQIVTNAVRSGGLVKTSDLPSNRFEVLDGEL